MWQAYYNLTRELLNANYGHMLSAAVINSPLHSRDCSLWWYISFITSIRCDTAFTDLIFLTCNKKIMSCVQEHGTICSYKLSPLFGYKYLRHCFTFLKHSWWRDKNNLTVLNSAAQIFFLWSSYISENVTSTLTQIS